MTTLEKIRAEIQKELDEDRNFTSENAKAQALALMWVLELFDKYAEQEPTDEWQNGYDRAWAEAEVFYEQEPCDDAISRNDMLDAVGHGTTYTSLEVQKIINGLPSVNPVPCEDAVSRQAVLDIVCGDYKKDEWGESNFYKAINDLPSVIPQEPKTGHWILNRAFPTKLYDEYLNEYKCSECYREIRCTESQLVNYPYCHCGARMVEPQEKRCADCNHYGKLSLDCGRCDDNCSMFEPQESEE